MAIVVRERRELDKGLGANAFLQGLPQLMRLGQRWRGLAKQGRRRGIMNTRKGRDGVMPPPARAITVQGAVWQAVRQPTRLYPRNRCSSKDFI